MATLSETHQTAAGATASAPAEGKIPGEGGVWVLIFADLMIFCTLFAAFLYSRSEHVEVFRLGQEHLSRAVGVLNTLLLLTSSLVVVGGVRAYERRRDPAALRFFAAAFACGVGFVISKYLEYSDKADHGLGPRGDVFFEYYYLMTGLHLFHLMLGLGCLMFVMVQVRQECTEKRLMRVEANATYWHMVDLVWLVVFALLYLVP